MNFALSQRASDQHPVGWMVVVGLHVLLAAALLSARISRTTPVVESVATLVPEVSPPPRIDHVLPPPQQPVLQHRQILVLPDVPVAPQDTPTITGKSDPSPQAPVVIAPTEPGPVALVPTRIQSHLASINAGASQCRPEYPAAAARAGTTGVSRIRFSVDAAGKVTNALMLASSGPTREHRLLDKAAADALQHCPITVGTDDTGRPVGTTTDVEYVWRLN